MTDDYTLTQAIAMNNHIGERLFEHYAECTQCVESQIAGEQNQCDLGASLFHVRRIWQRHIREIAIRTGARAYWQTYHLNEEQPI